MWKKGDGLKQTYRFRAKWLHILIFLFNPTVVSLITTCRYVVVAVFTSNFLRILLLCEVVSIPGKVCMYVQKYFIKCKDSRGIFSNLVFTSHLSHVSSGSGYFWRIELFYFLTQIYHRNIKFVLKKKVKKVCPPKSSFWIFTNNLSSISYGACTKCLKNY